MLLKRTAVWVTLHLVVAAFLLFLLPLFFLPRSPHWAWAAAALLPSANALFQLVHEGIHGHLARSRQHNFWLGRILAWMFGGSFTQLRTAHLLHHRYNRTELERVEVYERKRGYYIAQAFDYYSQLIVGLYLAVLFVPVLFCLLPRSGLRRLAELVPADTYGGQVARASVLKDRTIGNIRCEGFAVIVLFAASAFCYGSHWVVFLGVILGRGVCFSLVDYVYHYGSPVGDVRHAYNLSLCEPFSLFLLHSNYHGVHHAHPNIPWYELKAKFQAEQLRHDGAFFRHLIGQLRGPIFRDAVSVAPSRAKAPTARAA
jgi:fatty acid desaturase